MILLRDHIILFFYKFGLFWTTNNDTLFDCRSTRVIQSPQSIYLKSRKLEMGFSFQGMENAYHLDQSFVFMGSLNLIFSILKNSGLCCSGLFWLLLLSFYFIFSRQIKRVKICGKSKFFTCMHPLQYTHIIHRVNIIIPGVRWGFLWTTCHALGYIIKQRSRCWKIFEVIRWNRHH